MFHYTYKTTNLINGKYNNPMFYPDNRAKVGKTKIGKKKMLSPSGEAKYIESGEISQYLESGFSMVREYSYRTVSVYSKEGTRRRVSENKVSYYTSIGYTTVSPK